MIPNRLLLVDFSNMFSRCFHMDYDPALQYSQDAYERPKLRAVMLYSMCNLVTHFKPKRVAIALDAKPYWRSNEYEHYKENRKHSYNPEVFNAVREEIEAGLKAIAVNFAWLSVPGAEADDIIAVIANKCEESKSFDECVVYGSDGDFAQLDSLKKVKRYNPSKKMFVEKLGDPTKELLIKIVCGDAGDNIPPVLKGIGHQKALKMINENELDNWLDSYPDYRRDFNRNAKLIDFSFIPSELKKSILSALDDADVAENCNRKALVEYIGKTDIPEYTYIDIASKFNGDF